MAGVSRDKKREVESRNVDLISPHGAEITVSRTRAEQLLKRSPISFSNGVFRKYAYAGESNTVDMKSQTTTSATAPRKGTGANTGGS